MSGLAAQAELIKLGNTLEADRGQLDFLAEVPAEQLRDLRVAIYERLYREDADLFRRLAVLGSRLPAALVARVAEHNLGPLVTARVAAEMPGSRAASLAERLPTGFLADVVVHLDPRRTRDLIRGFPVERIVAVSEELERRGDFITISRFADFVSDEAISAVEAAIEDEGSLLRIAFFMGSKNRVDHLFAMLPAERLEAMLVRVEEESALLLPAFLSLLIHVSYSLKRKLGDLAAGQDERVLTGFVRAAHEQGLWADMLPVVAGMSEPSRRRVVNLAVLAEPAVQESVLRTGDRHGLWGILLAMIALMDDANREAVAGIVAAMPPAALRHAADAALVGEHWETLLDLVQRMPGPKQEELAAIVAGFGEVDPDLLERIAGLAGRYGVGEPFASVSRSGAS